MVAERVLLDAKTELANLRRKLEALDDQIGIGIDVRSSTTSGLDPRRDIERFAVCAIDLCRAVLDRRPITRGEWANFEGRRAKMVNNGKLGRRTAGSISSVEPSH